jgi:large repetitive protein
LHLRDNVTGLAVPTTITLHADGRTVTMAPTTALAVGRSHTLFIHFFDALRDLSGNFGFSASISFTTSNDSDLSPPAVLLITPAQGLTGVPINTDLEVLFDEPIDATRLEQVELLSGGSPVPVTRSLTNGNRTLVLTPATLLAPGTSYTLSVSGVADTAGNVISGTTQATFTTGPGADFISPAVSTFLPAAGTTGVPVAASAEVTFNEPINPLSAFSNVVLRLTNTGVLVPVSLSFSADRRTVVLTPLAPLAAATQYTIAVTNFSVRDLAGNVAPTTSASFTTQ